MRFATIILVLSLLVAACAKRPAPLPTPAPKPATGHPVMGVTAPVAASWVAPLTGANCGALVGTSGVALEVHCVTQVITAGETLYVFLIDAGGNPCPISGGTAAMNGGVSGGMTAVGNDVTFSDQSGAAMHFSNGFTVAASTTPDTFTAPNAADRLRCDAKLVSNSP